MNISHSEYAEKYNLYLDIIRRREQMEQQDDLTDSMYSIPAKKLFVFSHASMYYIHFIYTFLNFSFFFLLLKVHYRVYSFSYYPAI